MAKSKTPSFILELELSLDPHERAVLKKRLDIGRRIYNACLGQALKGLHKVRADKEYQSLLKEKNSKVRAARLKEIERACGYSEYQLQSWAKMCGKHFKGQVSAPEVQKLATRAFDAVEKLHYGKARRVYFKGKEELVSIEGKSNRQGIRWRDGKVIWGGLHMGVRLKKRDDYAKKALMHRVKYVRIMPKVIRGKTRFYAQLILEGTPPVKDTAIIGPRNEKVGIDPGTSTMAGASRTSVFLEELAPGTEMEEKKLRRIQRAMDRSRRASNPENYNEDGTVKKGRKKWTYSNRYKRLAAKRKEIYRKKAVKRKQDHERLANRVISTGLDVRTETMQYKGLQRRAKETTKNGRNGKINKKKRFGKSLSNRAPAMFLSILDRKLQYHGATLKKIDTKAVKASRLDHVTGEYVKKELSQRWSFIDGRRVQRDLYSAFLIANTADSLDMVDKSKADEWYDLFLSLHDEEIKNIKENGSKFLKKFIT